MPIQDHNFLYVIWKDPITRRNYIVGKLSRMQTYSFEYCGEQKEASLAGWRKLDAFPDEKVYSSEELFAAFACRLPDPKRRDMQEILKKYNLDHYDGYELLKRSSGRLPIDTYEFIDPIFPEDETIIRDFYIMGIRHKSSCQGISCFSLPDIKPGDLLVLKMEPDNEHDHNAVMITTVTNEMLGYIPRYYSESVSQRLQKGMSYSCTVVDIQRDHKCEDCIKVRLKMPKEV